MTDENGTRFCTECGAALPPGSEFCPHCGRKTDGTANPYRYDGPSAYAGMGSDPYATRVNTLGYTPTLILIYGIFAVMMGLMTAAGSTMITEDLWNEIYPDLPFDPNFATTAMVQGAMLLVSGLLALVSGILSAKTVHYGIAFYACIGAGLLSICLGMVGVLTLAIGILMAMRLRRGKASFSS